MIYIAVEQKNGKKTSIYFKSFFFISFFASTAITGYHNGAKYDNFDSPDCTYVQSVARQGSATNKGSAAAALVQE